MIHFGPDDRLPTAHLIHAKTPLSHSNAIAACAALVEKYDLTVFAFPFIHHATHEAWGNKARKLCVDFVSITDASSGNVLHFAASYDIEMQIILAVSLGIPYLRGGPLLPNEELTICEDRP